MEEELKKFVKMLPKKEINLEGNTTIRLPRKIVVPLNRGGIDVPATVENFLKELLKDMEERTEEDD